MASSLALFLHTAVIRGSCTGCFKCIFAVRFRTKKQTKKKGAHNFKILNPAKHACKERAETLHLSSDVCFERTLRAPTSFSQTGITSRRLHPSESSRTKVHACPGPPALPTPPVAPRQELDEDGPPTTTTESGLEVNPRPKSHSGRASSSMASSRRGRRTGRRNNKRKEPSRKSASHHGRHRSRSASKGRKQQVRVRL